MSEKYLDVQDMVKGPGQNFKGSDIMECVERDDSIPMGLPSMTDENMIW